MPALFLFFMAYVDGPMLTRTVVLSTDDPEILNQRPTKVKLLDDGSFLIATRQSVYHFEPDGRKRLTFGRQGQGPNEYQAITAAVWDGRQYWVSDGPSYSMTRVDNDGVQVKREPVFLWNYFYHDGQLWAVNKKSVNQELKNQPNVIQELDVNTGEPLGKPFHKLATEIVNLGYNFSIHHMSADDRNIYILDQLNPEITAYDRQTRAEVRRIPLRLPYFVQAPGTVVTPRKVGLTRWKAWLKSFSRILGLARLSKGYAVLYETPHPTEPGEYSTILCMLDEDGRKSRYMVGEDWRLLGARNDEAAILTARDNEETGEFDMIVRYYR
ncbi:MAG: hypothetical protein QNK37_21320 [Acidobacteriota bacterium]|nr:hypothetical protein [Acidobacteriota bacterium]